MRWIASHVLHTMMTITTERRSRMIIFGPVIFLTLGHIFRLHKTDWQNKRENFRQVVELVRLLRKTDDIDQAVQLIRLLNRTNSLGKAAKLLRSLRRTGNMRGALELVRSLNKHGNFGFVWPIAPGHYYSPLPDAKEVSARSQVLFDRTIAECPGIDLREEAQLTLLKSFA